MKLVPNLDWVEVSAVEPRLVPRDENYFIRQGYQVRPRDYGTPLFRSMFTLVSGGHDFIEIRRDPYSLKRDGGIFEEGACHIRLSNRTCYFYDAIDILRKFMEGNMFRFVCISRIDICADFNYFAHGDNPQTFLNRYMRDEYIKCGQRKFHNVGIDGARYKNNDSCAWKSKTSVISAKLYNKTKELREQGDKPYIRECWKWGGLDVSIDVWRVEFSISSKVNTMLNKKTGEYQRMSLSMFDDKRKQNYEFHNLAARYFHFKHREFTRDGEQKRRRDCRDKVLFLFDPDMEFRTPLKFTEKPQPSRFEKMIIKKLKAIASNPEVMTNIRSAAALLSKALYNEVLQMALQTEYGTIPLDDTTPRYHIVNFLRIKLHELKIKEREIESLMREIGVDTLL